ncbi:MAG: MoxR family ATPase [Nitrospirae bacterium]|nr:MoxR family ATPase [Nitrospirota bacterium]MBI3352856.1 MoxR family ATPase [Nitrospirota bacterium]
MSIDKRIGLLVENIEKIVTGKAEAVKMAIVTLLAKGHLLIEDVPGVGKTTLAEALSRSIDCSFKRIQFTSDLLPSDILGVSIYNQQKHQFEFTPGPIFSNIILADEINRTTPKTQSCLLESMSEAKVSIENKTFSLPQPFMVVATQNPIEYQGTYPLPESQLDRFLLCLTMGYPSKQDEKKILISQIFSHPVDHLKPVLTSRDVLELQERVLEVKMAESLVDYILAIVEATRRSDLFNLGVSTRGTTYLYRAVQALAFVEGRSYGIPDDVKRLVPLVFSHRVILNRENSTKDKRFDSHPIYTILQGIPVPL